MNALKEDFLSYNWMCVGAELTVVSNPGSASSSAGGQPAVDTASSTLSPDSIDTWGDGNRAKVLIPVPDGPPTEFPDPSDDMEPEEIENRFGEVIVLQLLAFQKRHGVPDTAIEDVLSILRMATRDYFLPSSGHSLLMQH